MASSMSSSCYYSCRCHQDQQGHPQSSCYKCTVHQCSKPYGPAKPSAPPEEAKPSAPPVESFSAGLLPIQPQASTNAPIECGICLEVYNGTTRRPRTLPCGHNFCGPCLQKCIAKVGNECSVCRKEHTATTIDDIPINTDLEQLIQMWSAMTGNMAKTNVSNDEEDAFSNKVCSRHKQSLLYFKCITHGIYICRECAVLDHSPLKCNIIEIKEEVTKTKAYLLRKAEYNINNLKSSISTLKTTVVEKNVNISNKQARIDTLMKEINEESKDRDQAQKEIDEYKSIVVQLQESSKRLQKAKTNEKCNKEFSELKHTFGTLGKHLKELEENKDIVKESSILRLAGDKPIVYLELSVEGQLLGGLQIQLTCGPRRLEQILRLCTGHRIGGATFKGSWFDYAHNVGQSGEHIQCLGYLTPRRDDGDSGRSNNIFAKYGALELLPQCKRLVAGAVTGCSNLTNFNICTRTDQDDKDMAPEIGRLVVGQDLLQQAIENYTTGYGGYHDASKIRISDAGVEMIDHHSSGTEGILSLI